MCTALVKTGFFGRNLDLERSYDEAVAITPRRFPIRFCHLAPLSDHLAIIGMAHIADGTPLYFDAMNEKGLCAAALRFAQSAAYHAPRANRHNIASFELIPYLLSRCDSVSAARALLEMCNITDDAFSPLLSPAPLHWMLADEKETLVIESTADGVHVYDNPVGVLTNEPPFPVQSFSLNNCMALSPEDPQNRFLPKEPLLPYSRGMGALGLPGDWSSPSRFVRAAFVRAHSSAASPAEFLRLLESVAMPKGCVRLPSGLTEYTRYSCCCDMHTRTYHYRTYEADRITSVNLTHTDTDTLTVYPIG